MPFVRHDSFFCGALLFLALAAPGVTAAQPAALVPDLKSIAGKWSGIVSHPSGPMLWTGRSRRTERLNL